MLLHQGVRGYILILASILGFWSAACATDPSADTAETGSSTDGSTDRDHTVDSRTRDAAEDTRDGAEDTDPDAGDSSDATDNTSDADADLPISCEKIRFVWYDFVENNRSCAADWECAYAGGSTNYCNCAISIGELAGDPINRRALPSAQPYLDRFAACRAAGFPFSCGYDHAPSKNLRCASGTCVADQQSCLPIDPIDTGAGGG